VTPERWERVESIFHEALGREPNQRALFLDQACGDDAWLRQKVEGLIRSHDRAGSFLESPASTVNPDSPSTQNEFVGRRLGPYELRAHIGSGGMGHVYRAHDTKLKRNVAIKILPAEFSRDPDRIARFQREAVALAALNHPNIAAIHDLEEIDDTRFLVLEFVEGETLAGRLKRGPLSVGSAIEIARQVAEGLAAAHAKGIHHRDLKPDNIQITPDDRVKLLDFGLAKMLAPEGDDGEPSSLPTITQWNTKPGVILGTAAYLSPEQARGRQPDRRSDVWAFGCVLFEALTGKMAFSGETLTDLFVAILKSEPDWKLLPAEVPSPVQRLLERCLQKEPAHRFQDIADVRAVLQGAAAAALVGGSQPRRKVSSWITIPAVAITAAAIAAVVAWNLHPAALFQERPPQTAVQLQDRTPELAKPDTTAAKDAGAAPTQRTAPPAKPPQTPPPIVRFSLALPRGQRLYRTLTTVMAISPDGANVVYINNDELYLRPLSGEATVIPGTQRSLSPVFSPDGRWVAFWSTADRALKKVSLAGGAPIRLSPIMVAVSNLSWGGEFLVYPGPEGIVAIPAAGGIPEVWIPAAPGEILNNPQLIDQGRSVLFSTARTISNDRWDNADIELYSRTTGQRTVLIRGGSAARYIPTGHIVYARGNTLFAVRFDPRRQTVGPPVPIVDAVMHNVNPTSWAAVRQPPRGPDLWPYSVAQFDFSADGTLVYVPTQSTGEIRVVLKWFDELRQRVPSS
jgi:eukaryotic-like serine/threonine-protein kinase